MIQHPVKHLTSNYRRDENSNNYKILDLGHQEHLRINKTLQLLESWRDMDNAEGFILDKIGKNVLELREGRDDISFRKAIKIKIRKNLSAGLVEDFNIIGEILFGDNFEGITETWQLEQYAFEPAGVSLAVSNLTREQMQSFAYISGILTEIKAGGVRLFWDLYWKVVMGIEVVVSVDFHHFSFPLTNTEITGAYPSRATKGNVSRGGIEISHEGEAHVFQSDITGTKPHPVYRGSINRLEIETRPRTLGHRFEYLQTDTDITGTRPHRVTQGNIYRSNITAAPETETLLYQSEITGTKPHDAYNSELNSVKTDVKATLQGAVFESEIIGNIPERNTQGVPKQGAITPKVTVESIEFHIKLCGTGNLGG